MEIKEVYTDINIEELELKYIGSILVFKLGKVINLYGFMNYDYSTGFFPFIINQEKLDKVVEVIGEIFISSIISGNNVDYLSSKDFPYKKSPRRDKKIGFYSDHEYDIKISDELLVILGKISLVYIANKTISYDFIDVGNLIITAHKKFGISKKNLISVSGKIPKYSYDVMLMLVNSGLLKLIKDGK